MSDGGLRIDFSGVEVKNFDPLPVGGYPCKITDGEVRDSKDGPSDKNPSGQYISFEFTVQPPHELADRKTWRNAPIAGDGVGILKSILAATGKFTDEALDGPLDFKIADVIGSDVICVQGKARDWTPDNPVTECKRVKPSNSAAVAGSGSDSLLP